MARSTSKSILGWIYIACLTAPRVLLDPTAEYDYLIRTLIEKLKLEFLKQLGSRARYDLSFTAVEPDDPPECQGIKFSYW
jgi:hypothetical protein